MYAPVRYGDLKTKQLRIDAKLKLEKFITENNFKKLENLEKYGYPIYLDNSSYYTDVKNEIYRISKCGTILDGPIGSILN
jgi:hypothetical protein